MKSLSKTIFFLLILMPFSVSANFQATGYKIQNSNIEANTNTNANINQWYLEKIKAEQAWETTIGKKQVVVAVLDTGIDINHPDLLKNIWVNMDEMTGNNIDNDANGYIDDINGWDFIRSKPNPRPYLNYGYDIDAAKHGTFIAGVIAAMHNDLYVDGIAPDIKIMPLKVLSDYGYGYSYPVAEAINYAIDNGADIVNLSFGGVEHSQALKSAILRAYNAGVLVVAAAGNAENGSAPIDLENYPLYPICYDQEWDYNAIIGVAATDKDDKKAVFSNYGKGCVDISAPGIDIAGITFQDDDNLDFAEFYATGWEGSSFATAMVSGAAALIKSINQDWSNEEIIQMILDSADGIAAKNPDFKEKLGNGRLNVQKAVEIAAELAGIGSAEIFLTAQNSNSGTVEAYNLHAEKVKDLEMFSSNQTAGLNLAITEIAGEQAVVAGSVAGEKSWVRAVDFNGRLLASFLAYDLNFSGGVKVAAGDTDQDGEIEIIVMPQFGRKPEIKIFNLKGSLENSFFVPGQVADNMNLAVGDVDLDGRDEILVGAGKGMSPEIKIFDEQGNLQRKFSAFVPQFRGGVSVAVADVQAGSGPEIVVAAGAGGGPHIQIFDYSGKTLNNFFAYNLSWREGLQVSAVDFDNNGKKDILVYTTKDKKNYLRVFNFQGVLLKDFSLATNFSGKWNIAGR